MKKKRVSAAKIVIPIVLVLMMIGGIIISVYVVQLIRHVSEPIGGDWRVWRGYTSDYILSENLTVTFSYYEDELEDGTVTKGYGVYHVPDGGFMGCIRIPQEENSLFSQYQDLLCEDRNDDGQKDIGMQLTDGRVLWFDIHPGIITDDAVYFLQISEE